MEGASSETGFGPVFNRGGDSVAFPYRRNVGVKGFEDPRRGRGFHDTITFYQERIGREHGGEVIEN